MTLESVLPCFQEESESVEKYNLYWYPNRNKHFGIVTTLMRVMKINNQYKSVKQSKSQDIDYTEPQPQT